MDDTILLATSREAASQKLQLLYDSANDIDMIIHPSKSKFIAVNVKDTTPFQVGDVYITHTDSYTYLGSTIMATSITKQVEECVKSKQCHVWKYQSFVNKNHNAPYKVKQTVLYGAVSSSLLYGCETWMTKDLKCVDSTLVNCLKSLLGVRNQTCSDLVYMETGACPASAVVQNRQKKCINRLLNRNDFNDLPVGRAIQLARQLKSPMALYMDKLLEVPHCIINQAKAKIMERVENSTQTRLTTYRSINSELKLHPVYDCTRIYESVRITFSRMRLSSHYLRIETGRWSRLPREHRLCICGLVQSEEHVLLYCPETDRIRSEHQNLDYTCVHVLMSSTHLTALTMFIHKCMVKMERNY
jgi:hypothetical protein